MATRTASLNSNRKIRAKRKKNNPKKNKKQFLPIPTRILIVLICFCFALGVLIYKLLDLQIFERTDRYADQVNQLIDEVQISAKRGDIYDRNMNVLVQDSSAKSVNIIPNLVKEPEKVAQTLSDDLDVDYDKVMAIINQPENDKVQVADSVHGKNTDKLMETLNNPEAYIIEKNAFYVRPDKVVSAESDAKAIALSLELNEETVLEKLTAKENTPVLVKNKIDNQLAQNIQEQLAILDEDGEVESENGIELLEDQKRYYTNGNFASYLLGFTGSDHEGLYGVEKAFNETLGGTKGIVYYQKDAQGNIITSQTKMIQESQKGEDLVLSIDSNIQSATEKALEKTVDEWSAKEGTAIVLNCKTGEIMAMASKPDYDLNDPYTISDEYAQKHSGELGGLEKTAQVELMWKNPAVSFIYEPGSTFKPVTTSIALEEGAITPDTTFNCTGSINVQGTIIHCTGVHGTQTIEQILENSCNPGLVQIISGVDPNDFYKYVYNFGFGQKTGIELTGEEDGIVNRVFMDDGTIKIVDYSTFSFGQGLATTPIQIVTALNSIINNGYFIKPTIIKTENQVSPKQIISSSTSQTLRNEMRSVLNHNAVLQKMQDGYDMGGKTGTAEKFINGSYNSGKYVTSFFCFSPVDDPQYCAMVILDEPKEGASGAASAAPTAIEILKQALIYTGSNPNGEASAQLLVPDCVGKELNEVEPILNERNIPYRIEQNGSATTVISQSVPALTNFEDGMQLVLTLGNTDEPEMIMPDFTGMTVQSVNEKAKELKIHLEVQGTGFATGQDVAPGTPIEENMKIVVHFEE